MRKLTRMSMIVVGILTAIPLMAQPNLKLDFEPLANRAVEAVEVKLDRRMLDFAVKFLSSRDAEEREIREIVKGLEGIYIYSFTFDDEWEYDRSIADAVRKQIGPGWEPIVTVRSRTSENVDVWVRPRGESLDGIFIVAAEPREFTIVNILGTIDIDKLSRLEGQFGIPDMEIEVEESVERKKNR